MAEHSITRYLRMLEPEGWSYQQGPGENPFWWRAVAKTRRSKLEVFLSLNPDCLTVQAPVVVTPNEFCAAALWRYLLRLNNEMRVVKFSLDGEDKIYLSAEVALAVGSGPTFADVKAVLTALKTYYDQFHREIELLATNRKLAESWLSLVPRSEELQIAML